MLPLPGSLSTAILPPCSSTILETMARPRPTPCGLVVKNGLKMLSRCRAAGGTAEISVIDRGAGIDAQHLDGIFNPFFTTKPQGVGLGLAIVSKIVDEHGGKIAVESDPGKGSVFRVLLPMERAGPSGRPQPSA